MADGTMQDYWEKKEREKSFWGRMGLIPKIIIVIAVILIATTLIFGFKLDNIFGFVQNVITVGIAGVLIYFAVKGVMGTKEPEAFSITEDFRTKLVNQAMKLKPMNVYQLWLRGEGMRSRALIGNVVGLGHLPYVVSKQKTDEKGNVIFLKDSKGNILKDNEGNQIPDYDLIYDGDGDTILVVKTGGFWGFFSTPDIIRCHKDFHSELIGDVYIKDLGLVPFGEFFYPSKQWAKDIQKIKIQNEVETITHTFYNNLDLIANITTMSVASDPFFQKLLSMRTEELSKAPTFSTMPAQVPSAQYIQR